MSNKIRDNNEYKEYFEKLIYKTKGFRKNYKNRRTMKKGAIMSISIHQNKIFIKKFGGKHKPPCEEEYAFPFIYAVLDEQNYQDTNSTYQDTNSI